MIKETLKRIYSGENVLIKHTLIFLLTGVVSMLSVPLNTISKSRTLTDTQWLCTALAFLFVVAVGFYMMGYMYKFIHESYNRENPDILPKFDLEPFKIGFKMLPIIFSWIGYALIATIVCIILWIISSVLGAITGLLLTIITILFFMYLPMLYSDFAREYSSKGLKNPVKPFSYIPETFGHVIVVLIKLIPAFLLILLLNTLAFKDPNVTTFIAATLGGYFNYIYNMTLSHEYADILVKHHIK